MAIESSSANAVCLKSSTAVGRGALGRFLTSNIRWAQEDVWQILSTSALLPSLTFSTAFLIPRLSTSKSTVSARQRIANQNISVSR